MGKQTNNNKSVLGGDNHSKFGVNPTSKKQLVAAVTLAVMGAATVGMPMQAWADSGQLGSETAPITWEQYNGDKKDEIKDNRDDKSGANVFVAQYHQNFNDNAYAAFGDMGGKTISITSMEVEAIQGKDGVGAGSGEKVHEGAFGQAGGMASINGIYTTNISNVKIAIDSDTQLRAIGGKTYSEAKVGEKYQHEGEKGSDRATDSKLNGGEGAKGGTGGKAFATGIDVANGNKIDISGGKLTVTAEGSDGGHGGYGGAGGIGKVGADGTKGTSYTEEFLDSQTVKGDDQTDGQAAKNGHNGRVGLIGNEAVDGSTGGIGGAGATGGNGGAATATGLNLSNVTNSSIHLTGLTVTATAGNGNAGGKGGAGGIGGAGGVGGEGGDGSIGEKGSDLGTADLVVIDGEKSIVADPLPTPTAALVDHPWNQWITETQHQSFSGKTYGGAGGAGAVGGLGGDGGIGGAGGEGGKGGQGGQAGSNWSIEGTQDKVTKSTQNWICKAYVDPDDGQTKYHWVKDGAAVDHGTEIVNVKNTVDEKHRTETNDALGGNGGQGGAGGTGGLSGENGESVTGGTAESIGLEFASSNINLNATKIEVTATAGDGVGEIAESGTKPKDGKGAEGEDGKTGDTANGTDGAKGGTGGAGGSGSDWHEAIAQSNNGATATAHALVTEGGTLNVTSESGLDISAKAENASTDNTAEAIVATDTIAQYKIDGALTISATATGDIDGTDGNTYKADQTDTTATATALNVDGGTMFIKADSVDIKAEATEGEVANKADALILKNADLTVLSKSAISIEATSEGEGYAYGITASENKNIFFQTENDTITVTGGERATDYAVNIDKGVTTFDAGTSKIDLNGKATFTDGELNLKSNTNINNKGESLGDFDITGSTIKLTDNLEVLDVDGKTTINGSKVYFYDDKNDTDKFNTTDYREIKTDKLDASGTNEFFMRTNANAAYGQKVGNDQIVVSGDEKATGGGIYEITVFDQGMRNGYNNEAGAEGQGHLNGDVVLIKGAEADKDHGGQAEYTINEMQYDNGVWDYEYQGKASVDEEGNLNLTEITTKSAKQSVAQMGAQDANKIAAGAAVTLFGADETMMERLGDLRNVDEAQNDGLWAKYLGGKIKVDGISGDNDFSYNGIAAGYDHGIGNNWRLGIAGQYAKGDTTLTNGDGEIKTAAGALYGSWTGDKGHHVDIIAKVGKVDSDTNVYGGTVAQKLGGEFSGTAMSLAVEYGYRKDLKNDWFIEPMVRASYVHLGGDDYTVTTRDGVMNASNDSVSSIILRGGFLLGKQFAQGSNVYLKAAVLHDFDGDVNTRISGDGRTASYSDSIGGTAIEYGIGINHKLNKDSSLYLDVERISGGDVTKNWGVNVGFRYSF